MALLSYVTGPYSGTYNSSDVGYMMDGYRLSVRVHAELINRTDAWGDSLLNYINRGMDVDLFWTPRNYITGAVAAGMLQWGTFGVMPVIGKLATAVVGTVVLTSLTGTTADVTPIGTGTSTQARPTTLTSTTAIIAPDFDVSIMFGPTNRDLNLHHHLLPTQGSPGTQPTFFTLA